MRGLVSGIDRTLGEIGQSVKTISGATVPFGSLEDNDDIRDVLDYIGDSLVETTLSEDRDVSQQEMMLEAPNAENQYYEERPATQRRRPVAQPQHSEELSIYERPLAQTRRLRQEDDFGL